MQRTLKVTSDLMKEISMLTIRSFDWSTPHKESPQSQKNAERRERRERPEHQWNQPRPNGANRSVTHTAPVAVQNQTKNLNDPQTKANETWKSVTKRRWEMLKRPQEERIPDIPDII